MTRRVFNHSEEQEIANIYEVGKFSCPEIAACYGASDTTIFTALRRQGVKIRSPGQSVKERIKRGWKHPNSLFTNSEETEIAKLYQTGDISVTQLAEAYMCSETTIYKTLRRLGIQRNQRQKYLASWRGKPVVIHLGYLRIYIGYLSGKEKQIAEKMSSKGGQVMVHRLIMALHLGRPLSSSEIVHHRDGNRENNELSNLMLLTEKSHTKAYGEPYYQKWQEALSEIQRLKEEK